MERVLSWLHLADVQFDPSDLGSQSGRAIPYWLLVICHPSGVPSKRQFPCFKQISSLVQQPMVSAHQQLPLLSSQRNGCGHLRSVHSYQKSRVQDDSVAEWAIAAIPISIDWPSWSGNDGLSTNAIALIDETKLTSVASRGSKLSSPVQIIYAEDMLFSSGWGRNLHPATNWLHCLRNT